MKKIILTEQEKNRIKLLYEVGSPPSESVFITNKNPFKYEEYKDARRTYTTELNDGDLFFKFKESLTKEYLLTQLNYIYEGKTVRLYLGKDSYNPKNNSNDRDEIVKIQKFNTLKFFTDYSYWQWTPMGNAKGIDVNNTEIEFNITNGIVKRNKYTHSDKSISEVYYYQFSIDDGRGKLEELIKNISYNNLPDNLFEIRKIQRLKTDY